MDFQTRYKFDPKTDLLGRGGFSKVYRANDTLLDRTVALKFFTADASEKYQVLNEIKKVIRFEHPNLCKYYDIVLLSGKNIVGEAEKIEVGILEYLDAGDLKTYLKNNPQHIDKLLMDVLKGLSYLHKKGIVHRDLKPQNILVKMVDDEPVAKITDFGISKLISSEDNNSSALIGTIEYMAPEQFNPKKYGTGGRITTNLDLWSFGLLVYEALQHKPLFGSRSTGTSAEQVMRNILSDSSLSRADSLPPKYRSIVKKCLVKHAPFRIQNAYELIPMLSEEGSANATDNVIENSHGSGGKNSSIEASEIGGPGQRVLNDDTSIPQPEDEINADEESVEMEQELTGQNTEVLHNEEEVPTKDTQMVVIDKEEPGIDYNHLDEQKTSEHTQVFHGIEKLPTEDNTIVLNNTELIFDEHTKAIQIGQEITGDNEQRFTPHIEPQRKNKTQPISTKIQQKDTAVRLKDKLFGKKVLYSIIPVALILLLLFVFKSGKVSEEEAVPDKPRNSGKTLSTESRPVIVANPELVKVEAGHFIMGNENIDDVSPESPAHEVNLNKFFIGKYEVTIDQFRQFINAAKYTTTAEKEGTSEIYRNGTWVTANKINWRHDINGNLVDSSRMTDIPVVHVSWVDANKYCEWLTKKDSVLYRLPTEAEWEFAARGGNNSKSFTYSGSDSIELVTWYKGNSGDSIHRVGLKNANELGIYDMSGNVLEWCNDWYDKAYYNRSAVNNPKGPNSGRTRVVRGGSSLLREKEWFRNSFRAGFPPDIRGGQLGFRICKPG